MEQVCGRSSNIETAIVHVKARQRAFGSTAGGRCQIMAPHWYVPGGLDRNKALAN
jgi:hypothetical protein